MRMLTIGVGAVLTVILAGCGSTPAPSGALDPLVAVAEDRLATADTVAASKWGTRGAVEDPAREQVVLDAAARAAAPRGLGAPEVTAVFRDQIQASKVVQYGLLEDWTAEPTHAPQGSAGLGGVRSVLDQVTPRLLDALAATAAVRHGPDCSVQLRDATRRVADGRGLDALHRRALDRALVSVCA